MPDDFSRQTESDLGNDVSVFEINVDSAGTPVVVHETLRVIGGFIQAHPDNGSKRIYVGGSDVPFAWGSKFYKLW